MPDHALRSRLIQLHFLLDCAIRCELEPVGSIKLFEESETLAHAHALVSGGLLAARLDGGLGLTDEGRAHLLAALGQVPLREPANFEPPPLRGVTASQAGGPVQAMLARLFAESNIDPVESGLEPDMDAFAAFLESVGLSWPQKGL